MTTKQHPHRFQLGVCTYPGCHASDGGFRRDTNLDWRPDPHPIRIPPEQWHPIESTTPSVVPALLVMAVMFLLGVFVGYLLFT